MHSCHLFLISSVSVSSVFFCPYLCPSLHEMFHIGISNFLEEISSLSHFIIFLYFFALINEEGFICPCCSLELCIQMVISFLFSFAFHFSFFFPQLFVRPPQTRILCFSISFLGDGFDPCLLYNVTNLCP